MVPIRRRHGSRPVRSAHAAAVARATAIAAGAAAIALAACTGQPPGGTPVGLVGATPAGAAAGATAALPGGALPAATALRPAMTVPAVAATPGPLATAREAPTAAPIFPTTAAPSGPTPPPTAGAPAPRADALLGQTVEGGAIGATYRLAAIRSGEHAGFTRLVWELREATGTPRYTATEVEAAGGGARIELTLRDVYAQDFAGTLSLSVAGSPVITGVSPLPLHDDAVLGFAVALARPARFEVAALENPVRIVVDVYP